MRIIFAYGILQGGGCERRMGELMRWLLDNGDECWLLASGWGHYGRATLYGQCGVPSDRIIMMGPGEVYEDFLVYMADELKGDLFDIQWSACLPKELRIPAVFTMHGVTQPMPELPWAGIICVEYLNLPPVTTIYNWVNLEKFPFRKELGEGSCFVGRAFKAINVKKVCSLDPTIKVDCYGTTVGETELPDWPPQECAPWFDYKPTEDTIYRYRTVFAAANTAMEAAAAGRLVIVGSSGTAYADRPAYGHLVQPHLLEALSRDQWAAQRWPHDASDPSPKFVLSQFRSAQKEDFLTERKAIRAYIEREHSLEIQCRKIRNLYMAVLDSRG
ncbi:MAG TPA: hypothetical protein VNA25_30250 [Phycisphaerae bacterium]|nr:hypothetical protein [Phycisphaerae bacterium]